MQIQELYNLAIWYKSEIGDKDIPNMYQNLLSILNTNTNSATKQPFNEEQESLMNSLNNINIKKLNEKQLDVLSKFAILKYIGTVGTEALQDILYRNSLDLASAAARVSDIVSLFKDSTNKFSKIEAALQELTSNDETEEIINLLKIHFTEEVAINNMADLKEWSSNWYAISRGISMIHGEAPEDFKIVSTENGSIILIVSATIGVILSLSKAIKAILEIVEKIYDIKIKKEELRKLQLPSYEEAAKILDKDIKSIKESKISDICNALNSSTAEYNGEIDGNIKTAIKKLVEFIEKGGTVDIDSLSEQLEEGTNEEPLEVKQFKANFESIHMLQEKIKLIEGSN